MKVSLRKIFTTFFKIGAFTFGGGYAMISVMQREIVGKGWATDDDMLDMVVIAESTPGFYAVNTATGVGYRLRGVLGAIVATFGVVLPSFIIICALTFAIDALSSDKWYDAAFAGVKIAATVLVVNAFLSLNGQLKKGFFEFVLLLAAFAAVLFFNFNAITVILVAALCGLVYSETRKRLSHGFCSLEEDE